jgi:hypothetical protein
MPKCHPPSSHGVPPTADGPGSEHFRGAKPDQQKAGWQEPQPRAADHDTPMPWGTNHLVEPSPSGEIPKGSMAQRIAEALKQGNSGKGKMGKGK